MRTWTSRVVRVTFKLDGKESLIQYLLNGDKSDAEAIMTGVRYWVADYEDDGAEITKAEIVEKHTYTDEED